MHPFFKLLIAISFTLVFFGPAALAIDTPNEMLSNPQQEQRAEAIGKQLRCLVCQNESIEESSSSLAATLRKEVREQVLQHKSDAEIHNWMTQHYGDYIELSPPLSPKSAPLWILPFLCTFIATGIIYKLLKGRKD